MYIRLVSIVLFLLLEYNRQIVSEILHSNATISPETQPHLTELKNNYTETNLKNSTSSTVQPSTSPKSKDSFAASDNVTSVSVSNLATDSENHQFTTGLATTNSRIETSTQNLSRESENSPVQEFNASITRVTLHDNTTFTSTGNSDIHIDYITKAAASDAINSTNSSDEVNVTKAHETVTTASELISNGFNSSDAVNTTNSKSYTHFTSPFSAYRSNTTTHNYEVLLTNTTETPILSTHISNLNANISQLTNDYQTSTLSIITKLVTNTHIPQNDSRIHASNLTTPNFKLLTETTNGLRQQSTKIASNEETSNTFAPSTTPYAEDTTKFDEKSAITVQQESFPSSNANSTGCNGNNIKTTFKISVDILIRTTIQVVNARSHPTTPRDLKPRLAAAITSDKLTMNINGENDSIEEIQAGISKRSSVCNCDDSHIRSSARLSELCECNDEVDPNQSVSTCTCQFETTSAVLAFAATTTNCSCMNRQPFMKIATIPLKFSCKPTVNESAQITTNVKCLIDYNETILLPSAPFECECKIFMIEASHPRALHCICEDETELIDNEKSSTMPSSLDTGDYFSNETIDDNNNFTTSNSIKMSAKQVEIFEHLILPIKNSTTKVSETRTKSLSECKCDEIQLVDGQVIIRHNCTCLDNESVTIHGTLANTTTGTTTVTVTFTSASRHFVAPNSVPYNCKCTKIDLMEGKIVIMHNCTCPTDEFPSVPCKCDDPNHCECEMPPNVPAPTPRTDVPSNCACQKLTVANGPFLICTCEGGKFNVFPLPTVPTPAPRVFTLPPFPTEQSLPQVPTEVTCKCANSIPHGTIQVLVNCTCISPKILSRSLTNPLQPRCRCRRSNAQCKCETAPTSRFVPVTTPTLKIRRCPCDVNKDGNCKCEDLSTKKLTRSLTPVPFGCFCSNSVTTPLPQTEMKAVSPLMLCECNVNITTALTTPISLINTQTTVQTTLEEVTTHETTNELINLTTTSKATTPTSPQTTVETLNYTIIEITEATTNMTVENNILDTNHWVRTVIKLDNEKIEALDPEILTKRLQNAYNQAFARSRRHQRDIKSPITVQILNISEYHEPQTAEIIYVVNKEKQILLADEAVAIAHRLSNIEMSNHLGHIAVIQAEEYIPKPTALKSTLSTGEIVAIGVCLPLLLILIILCGYRWYRNKKKDKKASNQQQVFEESQHHTIDTGEVKSQAHPFTITTPSTPKQAQMPLLRNENDTIDSVPQTSSKLHRVKSIHSDERKTRKKRRKTERIKAEIAHESRKLESAESEQSLSELIPHTIQPKPQPRSRKPLPLDIHRTDDVADGPRPGLKGAFDHVTTTHILPVPRPRLKIHLLPPLKRSSISETYSRFEDFHDQSRNEPTQNMAYYDEPVPAIRGIPWLKKAAEEPPAVFTTHSPRQRLSTVSQWDEVDEIMKLHTQVPCPAESVIQDIRKELQRFQNSMNQKY